MEVSSLKQRKRFFNQLTRTLFTGSLVSIGTLCLQRILIERPI